MAAFPNLRNRIAGDVALCPAPVNVLTGATPQFCAGDSAQFELAAFNNGVCITDISNLTNMILAIFNVGADNAPPAAGATALLTKTQTSLDNATTGTNWNAGTNQHAVFTLVTADTSGLTPGTYWIRFSATTNDGTPRVVQLGSGYLVVTAA